MSATKPQLVPLKSADEKTRVCVVGSGTKFVSGISYYTYFLSQELAGRFDLSVVLMRRLIPRFLYPGRKRVGAPITDLKTEAVCPTFDGVDWWAIPSLFRAMRFVARQRPEVLILQWWSASVLPWYLILAHQVRRGGGRIVMEMHEQLDTGEARLPIIGPLAKRALRRLLSGSDYFVVHSEWDKQAMAVGLGVPIQSIRVIPHGPYPIAGQRSDRLRPVPNEEPRGPKTVLFFGTIRPYKGLEHLVSAFNLLPRADGRSWKLLIVGEPWEGWTEPFDRIAASPYADDIEVVARYVNDSELPALFARVHVVALPYLRSSASGPLHLTMAYGLPVAVTRVGGLPEAATGYEGAVLVNPADPADLARGIVEASEITVCGAPVGHSWENTGNLFEQLINGQISESADPVRLAQSA